MKFKLALFPSSKLKILPLSGIKDADSPKGGWNIIMYYLWGFCVCKNGRQDSQPGLPAFSGEKVQV
jgi:hypothetical protein